MCSRPRFARVVLASLGFAPGRDLVPASCGSACAFPVLAPVLLSFSPVPFCFYQRAVGAKIMM
jgi:hypothetical protein